MRAASTPEERAHVPPSASSPQTTTQMTAAGAAALAAGAYWYSRQRDKGPYDRARTRVHEGAAALRKNDPTRTTGEAAVDEGTRAYNATKRAAQGSSGT